MVTKQKLIKVESISFNRLKLLREHEVLNSTEEFQSIDLSCLFNVGFSYLIKSATAIFHLFQLFQYPFR